MKKEQKKTKSKKRHRDARIVVVGGGTGVFALLTGLTRHFERVTAIVTMADDGGSSGMLREDFGILPPGDVRRALVALSRTDNGTLSALFNYRFEEGTGLRGHSFGNLMLTALERITGSFERAIEEAARILSVHGSVIPVTLERTRLFAELENGKIVKGETNIDIPNHDGRLRIKKVWLHPAVRINPRARDAIRAADLVVVGPGDLYTSLVPNLLVKGMREAIGGSHARVAYVVNLMTKFGETNHFAASDFVRVIVEHLGENALDYVIVNKSVPPLSRLRPYFVEGAELVRFDREHFRAKPVVILAGVVRPRGFLRHDPEKIARIIAKLV